MRHTLVPSHETLVGFFDPNRPAVLTIDPGDTVRCATLDAGWHTAEQAQIADHTAFTKWPDKPAGPFGHALIGPIAVRGAQAGQTLEVHIREVRVGSWGWGGTGGGRMKHFHALGRPDFPGFHLGWRLDAESGWATSHLGDRVRIRPFPGVVGMPPPEPGQHSTIPPRRWGGNLDCRELVAGTRLFLPIPVDGALLHLGDGHAAQGDGEAAGVAIECHLEHLEVDVHLHDHALHWPRFVTEDGTRGTLAVGDTTDQAWADALNAMVEWVATDTGRELGHVFALSSLYADLRITQVVNDGVVGVHCLWSEP